MENIYKNCQSCGMPLNKDEKGGGTNSDGSKCTMYCSHCFQAGQFTSPDITLDEMKIRVKGKMKEMKIPGFLAGIFTLGMNKLERWKSN